MDYSARSQMNSVNDHMSYTEDINYVIDSKLFKFHKNLYGSSIYGGVAFYSGFGCIARGTKRFLFLF